MLDETRRLSALQRYNVLDTPGEAAFDDIANAAAKICAAPMAAVSLVDETRQWFKAKVGLEVEETARELSFCAHAMRETAMMVVPDARLDPRFAGNALVTGEPYIRFYAGAAVHGVEGGPLGALCVMDTEPRPGGLTAEQALMLRVLADQVEPRLRLKRTGAVGVDEVARMQAIAAIVDDHEARLLDALDSADLGWWDWDLTTGRIVTNPRMALIFGLAPKAAREGVDLATLMANLHPQDRSWLEQAIGDACESGAPFQQQHRVLAPDGSVRWVSSRGRCLRDDQGKPTRFPGVAFDITAEKRTESRLHESEASREMALDAARLGRFDHDMRTGRRFYDSRALEMLDMTLDETQDIDILFAHIHPEDRERVRAAQQAALSPERRGPYHEVYRILGKADGQDRWISGTGRSHFADGVCVRFMGVLEDVTDAKRAEAHRAMLTRELDHRVKNTLAIATSLVDASLRATPDSASARPVIAARLGALGRAHDQLIAKEWIAATVSQIVHGVTQALSLPAERLHLQGEEVELGPKPALQLTLALHELATNAIKYGALSSAAGSVGVSWSVEPSPSGAVFGIDWVERDGPPVSPPTRRGFGSRLVESVTAAQFHGTAVLEYAAGGVHWRLRAPYAGLAELGRHAAVI